METRGHDQDREDARRVLAGDVDAFEGIVSRWQGPLVNLAFRFCRDRGLAEDMAQEAFLRAYRKLDRWRGDARFSTWLFSVAINVYRSRLRRVRPPEVPVREDLQRSTIGTPADMVLREQTGEVVRRAVSRLPSKYREVLVLVYFSELGVAGTAETLGVPVGTVKARLHRGREMLRRRLGGLVAIGAEAEAT